MKIGFVYKLVCKDVNAPEVYVGSSTSLRNRRAGHKSDCNNENKKGYNLPVYKYIRENGGWQNWELLTIERIEYEFGFELKDRERHHMEALHATLNSCVPGRTVAEWHNDHKNEIKQYQQQYYQDRKQILSKKHDCPCGGKYVHEKQDRHMKTERHRNYILGKQMYIAKFGHA
jgi:hypothetical protein